MIWLEILGEGAFGRVQKAFHKIKNEFVAIKTFKIENEKSLKQMEDENEILTSIENIRKKSKDYLFLEYYGAFKANLENGRAANLLMMEAGTTTVDNILRGGKSYSCDELVFFLFIIVKSLALLQKEGITNRDIKPENIILVKSHKYRTGFLYKISDFGIGCKLLKESSEVSNKTIKGFTKYFAAPEILAMNENSQKNPFFYAKYDSIKGDVFSLGITIMKMIDYNAKKERFLKDKEYFNKQLVGYEKLSTILQKMMEENPEKRINFIDLELLLKKQFNKREYLRKAKHVLPFFNVESNESKISTREILKYDEKYLKIQEGKKKTKKQSIEGIIKLFYIHFNYFKLYDHKISKYWRPDVKSKVSSQ